ncbi:MAG: glycosyltransferase [Candidatus Woesebacteria bacterium]|nr:glycosyltransferase [Candidatus Woesebacteria bacterium]
MKQKSIFWSIIVPCYNESKRVDNIVKIIQYLRGLDKSWELIVLDDGSTDDTLDKLKSLKKKSDFRLIYYKNNRGKGYAVKTGMLAATGEFRLFMDVDLSTPIEEMAKFSQFVDRFDVVMGTRKVKGAKVMVHQPILREYLGVGFTLLSQLILNTWVSDFTCGFKCFSREAAERIFQKTKIFRWGFDSESLFLAKKYGFSIKEVPVIWRNDRQTRVRFPNDIISSFGELLTIRYFDWVRDLY